jgi:hypothetical protein
MLGKYRVAAQLVASRVVLSSTELVYKCMEVEVKVGRNFHALHSSALGLEFEQQCPLTLMKIRNLFLLPHSLKHT